MIIKREKLYSFFAGFLSTAVIFVVFFVSFNFVLAAWSEPTQAPPDGNIAPPLNTGINNQFKIGGLRIGGVATTSKLCFGSVGNDCKTTWDDILGIWEEGTNGIFYSAGNVGVGPAFPSLTWPLPWARMAISMGSTNDREGLYISRDAISNYSYLNIENELGAPVFKVHESGAVVIGANVPNLNADLHIQNLAKNAEINIQSTAGVDAHWGIYHDGPNGGGTDDLRFWNNSSDQVTFSSAGAVTANDFCIRGVGCISDSEEGVYTGSTLGFYDGDQGGYTNANSICDVEFIGSHVCDTEEIFNTINSGGQMPTEIVWVFNGPPGYIANANDCFGRTIDDSGDNFGAIWLPSSGSYPDGVGAISQCNVLYKLACCN